MSPRLLNEQDLTTLGNTEFLKRELKGSIASPVDPVLISNVRY